MPPSFPGTGTIKFSEILMDPVLRGEMVKMTGDPNWLARTVNESEPNDTLEQANDLGTLSHNQPIHISGHVNGGSDPYDYFEYIASEPGDITVKMYKDVLPWEGLYSDELIYNETFTAEEAGESFWYNAWATGDASFNYDTYIGYSLVA